MSHEGGGVSLPPLLARCYDVLQTFTRAVYEQEDLDEDF